MLSTYTQVQSLLRVYAISFVGYLSLVTFNPTGVIAAILHKDFVMLVIIQIALQII